MCCLILFYFFFFFSSRRRHTRFDCDWSSDVCSSDLALEVRMDSERAPEQIGGFAERAERQMAKALGRERAEVIGIARERLAAVGERASFFAMWRTVARLSHRRPAAPPRPCRWPCTAIA